LLILTALKLPSQTSPQDFNLNAYVKNTWRGINNRQVFGLLFAIASLFMMQFGAFFTYIPLLAGNSLGASSTVIGIILATISLSLAFVASQLGVLLRFLPEITLIKVSFIVCALALSIIPALHNAWLLIIPSILFGAALGMAFPVTQALLARLAPEDYRAGFMAVNATFQSLGQALGPLLAGIAFGFWGMPGVFYGNAGFALATFILLNPLLTQKPRISTPTPPPTATVNSFSSQQVSPPPRSASFTKLQQQTARLIHVQTNDAIELPQNLSVIHIGKPNDRIPPDVDISGFPHSEIVSRIHANIWVEGYDYYIEDVGSYNGTYVNNLHLLPGNRYKLRPGDRVCLGKKELVKFLFQFS
jgi:MFS family permease